MIPLIVNCQYIWLIRANMLSFFDFRILRLMLMFHNPLRPISNSIHIGIRPLIIAIHILKSIININLMINIILVIKVSNMINNALNFDLAIKRKLWDAFGLGCGEYLVWYYSVVKVWGWGLDGVVALLCCVVVVVVWDLLDLNLILVRDLLLN